MIGIIDYGMGNLRSVQKGFERTGAEARIITTPDEIRAVDKLVLPGVGAFKDAARTLRDKQLIDPVLEFIGKGKPFLGICLGLQLLFDVSYEDGEYTGLGVIPGKVIPFDFSGIETSTKLKIPHMGWNELVWDRPVPMLNGLEQGCSVYFVHSYYVVPHDPSMIATKTNYGVDFTSMIWKDNIYATQFHPEKSQKVGLKMLENFGKL
ncbi:MAG: imidazole glycerol phosphate synthase subunit HisH [Phycisphaerae bacterium]